MLQAHCWQHMYMYYQNTLTSEHLSNFDEFIIIFLRGWDKVASALFSDNSEKLNNLPRSYKEPWGNLCLLSPGPVSQDDSPPWQSEPVVTGTWTDPCPDLWYWITVRSNPAGTKLLFILPRFWLTWIKSLMNELEKSLQIIFFFEPS